MNSNLQPLLMPQPMKAINTPCTEFMRDAYAPLRNLQDIETVEKIPLEERITRWDFAQNLLDGCRFNPKHPAIIATHRGDIDGPIHTWTFFELERRSVQFANLLHSLGIQSEDVVAVVSPTVPSLFSTLIGALLSARPFPINWMLDSNALADLLVQANARVVVSLGPTPGFEIWENVCAAVDKITQEYGTSIKVFTLHDPFESKHTSDLLSCADNQPSDSLTFERPYATRDQIACYVHSGGTTGHPKIVKVKHGGMVYRQWAANLGLAFTSRDVVLSDTPLFHIGGLLVRGLVSTADGHSTVIPSLFGARDKSYIANYWRYIERFGITQISGVPTTLSVLAKTPPTHEVISSLRPFFATGSTAIAPAVQARIVEITGSRALQSYGMTENTSHATLDPRDGPYREGCSGIRVPYTNILIVKMSEDGQAIQRYCELGEVGMVIVKGPGVSAGYLDPEHNKGVFLADGSLVTGDLGCLDSDGFIRISGRQKDIIIRSGHNIEPRLIEDALLRCPGVALAAAVGKPDAHAGELPIAYVQLHPGANVSEQELMELASTHIPERPAIPKEIIFLDHIPLTAVGKPQKHILQIDAAKRSFNQALQGVSGPWTLDVDISGGGLRLKIMIAPSETTVIEQIKKVLSNFAIQHQFIEP